ncbi:MAG: hypothetical protein ABR929_14000 [Roseiarcus sp.]
MRERLKISPGDRLRHVVDDQGEGAGAALIAAMQASPYREIDIEPSSERSPARDVEL